METKMKRLLIDCSSVCWSGLYAGEDKEFGRKVEYNGRMVQVNGAEHGREHVMNMIAGAWNRFEITPIRTILIVEGRETKLLRQRHCAGYKNKDSSHAPESYEEFNKLIEMLREDLGAIGVMVVTQDQVEGDDVIAYLAKNLDGDKYILSGDGDLAALVSDQVHLWRRDTLDQNPYGPFPHKYITVYKSLVGDTTDKIPGAPGFGEKSFLDLYCIFGDDGQELMEGLIKERRLHELEEDVPHLKALNKIIKGADSVYQSYSAARLYPNMVNTVDNCLQWTPGYVKHRSQVRVDERLLCWAGSDRLVNSANFHQALKFLQSKIEETEEFTLDLETSTPDESDEWLAANGVGVDVIGSEITGCGLTFGNNNQYRYYVTVDHLIDEDSGLNCTIDQLRTMLEAIPNEKITLAHNAAGFELPVLANTFRTKWKYNGWRGFFPNMIDTAIAACYFDENMTSMGLKKLSKNLLGYDQVSYEEVTQGKKMNQLTAKHVFAYGIDDVVMTPALWHLFKIQMEIDKTYQDFLRNEQLPMYLSAHSFLQGTKISLERLLELEKADKATHDEHRRVLDEYLIEMGWDGTICPEYSELTAANIKEIYLRLTGEEFSTKVRTPEKMFTLMKELDHPKASLIARLMEENRLGDLNSMIAESFDGKPIFDVSSPKQVGRLLYEVMALPVRMRNKATDTMRANGVYEGTPSTDEDAIKRAIKMGDAGEKTYVLKALLGIRTFITRNGLYWKPYPNLIHWKTGRIHPQLRQSSTNTRRWSCASPNIQQLDSEAGSVRTIILGHVKDAFVVSLDEGGQELRLAASYSMDANLLSCYVGTPDQLRDIHSIVASKIAEMGYEEYRKVLKGELGAARTEAEKIRSIAKVVVFASFYGAMAFSISNTLGVDEETAQGYIDVLYGQFPGFAEWKRETERQAIKYGYVRIMGGGVRHLREVLNSNNKWERAKALRQASNARIQSAGANQIKVIMCKVWNSSLIENYQFQWMFPVHDEAVFSVAGTDQEVIDVLKIMHGFMTDQFLEGGVPSASSIGIGRNFGDLVELGEVFDESLIRKTLTDLRNRT